MRILILTQFFTPEVGATQTRIHTFAAGLAARGHDVQVICEVPNHPQGIVHPGFRSKPIVRRELDGFRVTYVWVRTRPEKTTRGRLLFYGTYVASAALAGAGASRPDVIFASSPPLPVGLAGEIVAARHRVPWVLDVRDLWPDAAIALGELGEGRALRLAERLERRLYRRATAITVVTEPFRDTIGERVTEPGKIHVLPNGTTSFWLDGGEVKPDRAALGLSDSKYLLTFAGNVGSAQGLGAAIDAAATLDDDFQLLILGDGPARRDLERAAAGAPRGRIVFRDQVAPEVARAHLRASDCLLVPLAADPILSSFVPSKLFDFCATGRPVILAAAGEPARLASARGAALPIEPEDPKALQAAVRKLRNEPDTARDLGRAGLAFARQNLREAQIDRLEGLLDRARAGVD